MDKKRRKMKYFKLGDLIIYIFFIIIFVFLGSQFINLQNIKPSRAEIYVDGDLKYTYPLIDEEKNVFIDTNLGGVNVRFKDKKVRVTSSNSPLKINVKRGWIENPGEMIIGIPDRMIVKIVGDKKNTNDSDDIDYIIR